MSALLRLAPWCSAPQRSAPRRSAPLKSASLRLALLRSAFCKLELLRSAFLRSAPLRSASVKSTRLKSIPLRSVPFKLHAWHWRVSLNWLRASPILSLLLPILKLVAIAATNPKLSSNILPADNLKLIALSTFPDVVALPTTSINPRAWRAVAALG